jgi:hypothetical protein
MRTPALPLLFAVLLSSSAYAQATWQPSTPPLVTAENTTWYQTGEPILWNGDYYYPAGAAQGFNPYQMVRSGSFRGIPLYTDATIEPYSIVFVPLYGGRMQPYERRRTGALAGTTGSRAPSLPTTISAEGMSPAIVQAVGPPDFARSYDVASVFDPGAAPAAPVVIQSAPIPAVGPTAIGTSGDAAATPPRPVTTILPPTGLNAIWVEFNGQRWYGSGQSIAYDAARLNEIGSYRGWTVYARKDDPEARTIYIPSIAGRLAPYTRK